MTTWLQRVTNRLTGYQPETYTPTLPDVPAPLTLTAAAYAPAPPPKDPTQPPVQEWWEQAWEYYRIFAEARKSVNWLARQISRCHLFIGKADSEQAGDPVPVEDPGAAKDLLDGLFAVKSERELLYRMAIHLIVPGETWLLGYPNPAEDAADDDVAWIVASRKEFQHDGERFRIKFPLDDHPDRPVDGWVDFARGDIHQVRIWEPDPEDAEKATSPFEAVLRDLDELDGLARRTAADISSRLAGAGVFLIPESATIATPSMSQGVNPMHSNPFVTALTQAMSTAIRNPDSAEAVTPIVATISDEALAKAEHLTFSTPFDEQIPVLRDAARERIVTGLDVPKSAVFGAQDMNHWSAWQESEESVKGLVGPVLSLICSFLTREILQPTLKETGDGDEQLVVWWDASELVLRPDRSNEALAANKQGLISDKATRREIGFGDDDSPDETELARRFPPTPSPQAAGGRADGRNAGDQPGTPSTRNQAPRQNQKAPSSSRPAK